jgi:hypothetical protein
MLYLQILIMICKYIGSIDKKAKIRIKLIYTLGGLRVFGI